MLSPKNMNCTLFDEEEDYLDSFRNMDEVELGIFVIHTKDVVIPNLMQGAKDKKG